MRKLLLLLRVSIKKYAPLLSKLFGITLLTGQQTKVSLSVNATALLHDQGDIVTLHPVTSVTKADKQLFREETISTASRYVWRLENTDRTMQQLPNGSLLVHKEVLDLGFGNSAALKDLVKRAPRQARFASVLIAPWPHYWTGYFDYIFFIALNICRIKNELSAEEFAEAVVCYPLFNSSFEREILDLLGVKRANVLDSRHSNVVFNSCLIGNIDSWFYPNKHDVAAFQAIVRSIVKDKQSENNRIYIQRTGRRKVINENELLVLLKKFDFTIIADVPRTFAEQILLYYNASFIIGPHGASFANILGCRAGTHLFELFANTYMPGYFRYLAHLLELNYAAYCDGQPSGSDHSHVADDVFINLEELEQQLSGLLCAALV
ncbi:MAG: glycosyltransferase family 61 protein [Hymenobacter sp.]|nr:MAG: glycosyltransferase family 61 protein [Hymenobacter sp.]